MGLLHGVDLLTDKLHLLNLGLDCRTCEVSIRDTTTLTPTPTTIAIPCPMGGHVSPGIGADIEVIPGGARTVGEKSLL